MAQDEGTAEHGGSDGKKVLVVYFSRSGTTHKLALEISRELGADIERITDREDRTGFGGYMRSGKQALKDVLVEIYPPRKDPADYDLVIVGTPVWAYKMSSPIRSYLTRYSSRMKTAAFFCTADRKEERTLEDMAQLSGKPAQASMVVYRKAVMRDEHQDKVREFVATVVA